MSVYLITQGSYSDYHIIGAAASREEAERVVAKMRAADPNPYDQPEVEEYDFITADDVRGYATLHMTAEITRGGELLNEYENVYQGWDIGERNRADVESHYIPPGGYRKAGHLAVSGEDHERVRKVYSEKLAELRTDDALRRGGAA